MLFRVMMGNARNLDLGNMAEVESYCLGTGSFRPQHLIASAGCAAFPD